MAKRRHTEEEILRLLREAESWATVVEVCRKDGISQRFSLREENGKLKRWLRSSA